MALLSKQIWRILTNPNLLMSKVLKVRYFPHSGLLDLKTMGGALWIWKSLHSSIPLLRCGLRKQVGDGKTINIWDDAWLPGKDCGKINSQKPQGCLVNWVSDLISSHKWNNDFLMSLFSPVDVQRIQQIPLIMFGGKDRFC